MFEVEFPNIGLTIPLSKSFEIFGFEVYWYGVIIAAAMALSVILACVYAKRFNIKQDTVIDCALFGIVAAIFGARLYYMVFEYGLTKEMLENFLQIRDGGLAIYGGVIFGVIAVICVAIIEKINIVRILDYLAPFLVLGQSIGRWGNFINQEAFGTNTDLPWAMISDYTRNFIVSLSQSGLNSELPVHPTFLYESLGCLVIFFVLFALLKRTHKRGNIVAAYMVGYGILRTLIEGIRTDSLMLDDIRISQLFSILLLVAGVFIILYNSKNGKVEDNPPMLDEDSDDAQQIEETVDAEEEKVDDEAEETTEQAEEAVEVAEADEEAKEEQQEEQE